MIPSEQRIIDFLRNKEPQTVCAVAIHFNAHPSDIRQILFDMAADGDLYVIRREGKAELFEPAHGGYCPPGAA